MNSKAKCWTFMFSLYPLTQNAVPIFKLGQKEYFAIGGGGMVGRGHVLSLIHI